MKIQPIGERVLIEPIKQEEKTKGGIYLPDSNEKRKEGKVLAVGTTKDGKDFPVKVGDHILYGGYSSDEFEFDTNKYVIIELKDVVAKLQ